MLKSIRLVALASLVCALVTACGRDTSSLSKTLIGHWVTTKNGNEEVHRCYAPDGRAIYYNKTTDRLDKLPYTIISESPQARTAVVNIGYNGTVEGIQFSPDNKSAEGWFDGMQARRTWKYVNSQFGDCR